MAIQKALFTLVSKRQLTYDVFELTFSAPENTQVRAGEYILFALQDSQGESLKRAYSISYYENGMFSFVIRRVDSGKGSPILCDSNVGDSFECMGPMGHFVLRETEVSKCFIGTGTGFAPLYFQLRKVSEIFPDIRTKFVFGVREKRDLFYDNEIAELQKNLKNFSVDYYLSREVIPEAKKGYVTEFLIPENVLEFEEFYICGSPVMVKETREKLESLGVAKEKVFFEQF